MERINQNGETLFSPTLIEATIMNRPNRFIMNVQLPSAETVKAHCPTTGGIGGARLDNLACLLSGPYSGRKTDYTVEALSFHPKDSPLFQWIGINQTAVNKYFKHALQEGLLSASPDLAAPSTVKSEPKLGPHRLDFLVNDNVLIEVKTPLKMLQTPIPEDILMKKNAPVAADRMVSQLEEIANALQQGQKALMVVAFMYNNPGFKSSVPTSETGKTITAAIDKAKNNGLEIWQANFALSPEKVSLTEFYPLTILE